MPRFSVPAVLTNRRGRAVAEIRIEVEAADTSGAAVQAGSELEHMSDDGKYVRFMLEQWNVIRYGIYRVPGD
jgi:hypothetical protein